MTETSVRARRPLSVATIARVGRCRARQCGRNPADAGSCHAQAPHTACRSTYASPCGQTSERKRRANQVDSHAVASSASASRSCWAACSLRYCGSSFLMGCHHDTRPVKQVSSGKGGWCTELHRDPAEGEGTIGIVVGFPALDEQLIGWRPPDGHVSIWHLVGRQVQALEPWRGNSPPSAAVAESAYIVLVLEKPEFSVRRRRIDP